MVLSSLKQENVLKETQETVVNERTAGVTADFVPPPILSPRTKSASGYCPPGQYPLADIVPPSPNLSPPQQLLFKLCFPLTQ